MESKIQYKWTYLQSRNKLIIIENKLMVTKKERGEKIKRHINHGYYCILMAYSNKLKELSIVDTETIWAKNNIILDCNNI